MIRCRQCGHVAPLDDLPEGIGKCPDCSSRYLESFDPGDSLELTALDGAPVRFDRTRVRTITPSTTAGGAVVSIMEPTRHVEVREDVTTAVNRWREACQLQPAGD